MIGDTLSREPRRALRGKIGIAYWDSGSGTPLVLITGLATPAASWSVLPDMLATAGYRAIVIDNRDCGRSSRCRDESYSIGDMADDVAAVMDELKVEAAYVLGISMGGMIAQELALRHPSRVRKLMLLATTHGGPDSVVADAGYLTELFAPVATSGPKQALIQMVASLTGPGFADRHPEAVEMMATVRARLGSEPDAFFRQWEAISSFNTADRLGEVRVPTLVIHGTADRLVPTENGRLISSKIPGAELIELDGIGHLIPLEDPITTTNLISEFFPVEITAEAV